MLAVSVAFLQSANRRPRLGATLIVGLRLQLATMDLLIMEVLPFLPFLLLLLFKLVGVKALHTRRSIARTSRKTRRGLAVFRMGESVALSMNVGSSKRKAS